MKFAEINHYMNLAYNFAEDAFAKDEVPVGAIIVSRHGEILAEAFNLKEQLNDATAHAEILAIRKAAEKIKSWRLIDCSMYVTLEPCPMCLSAILQSRIKNLYFGAYDKKGGAISLGYNFSNDKRFNHQFNVYGGFKHFECSRLLSNYFKAKRKRHDA